MTGVWTVAPAQLSGDAESVLKVRHHDCGEFATWQQDLGVGGVIRWIDAHNCKGPRPMMNATPADLSGNPRSVQHPDNLPDWIGDGTAGPNLMRPTAPAINNPQPSRGAFGEHAHTLPKQTPEANRQAALAGGPPARRDKVAGDVCKPGICAAILMNAPDGTAVCPENWIDGGGDLSELSHAGEPLKPHPDAVREDAVTVLGEYLYSQMRAYPQLSEWLAVALVGRLVATGKKPDMPGAVRVLIDITRAVEATNPTPADPPSPPAKSTTGGATPRRRWWSPRRWLWSPAGAAILAGIGLWLYEGLFGWHG